MIQAYFYLESDVDAGPLGELEYWLEVVPRKGEIVSISVAEADQALGRRPLHGEGVDVQWTFEKNESSDKPDYCTVDITLRELP
jgi:hypothetical protein